MRKQERERDIEIDPDYFWIISVMFNPSAQMFLVSIFLDWTFWIKLFLPKATKRWRWGTFGTKRRQSFRCALTPVQLCCTGCFFLFSTSQVVYPVHLAATWSHGMSMNPAPLFPWKMSSFGFEARDGNFEVLALLLKYGVDKNVLSSKGQTPLDMARSEDVSWSWFSASLFRFVSLISTFGHCWNHIFCKIKMWVLLYFGHYQAYVGTLFLGGAHQYLSVLSKSVVTMRLNLVCFRS